MHFLRVIAALAVVSLVGVAQERAPLRLTYVANEGFLIDAGGHRVLVDALFRDGVGGYASPSPDMRRRLEGGDAAFRDAAFVLASHVHDDHFDAAAVAAYMVASPATRFVSTPQAFAAMRGAHPGAAWLDRVEGVLPREGERERRMHRGVTLQVLNVHHGRTRPTQNLGLLVDVGGYRILHIGDSEASAADLRSAGIRGDRVDVFFVPYWYFTHDDGRRAVREAGARHLVVMHAGAPEVDSAIRRAGGFPAWFALVKRDFGNALWLAHEGESVEVR